MLIDKFVVDENQNFQKFKFSADFLKFASHVFSGRDLAVKLPFEKTYCELPLFDNPILADEAVKGKYADWRNREPNSDSFEIFDKTGILFEERSGSIVVQIMFDSGMVPFHFSNSQAVGKLVNTAYFGLWQNFAMENKLFFVPIPYQPCRPEQRDVLPLRILDHQIRSALICLYLLSVKSHFIKTETVTPSPKLNKARVKRKKKPLSHHTIVDVNFSKEQHEAIGQTSSHSSPRVHLVRGHFKLIERASGEKLLTWWRPFVRGDKSKGLVTHDYSIRA